jgi:hypothetical protein
MLKARSPEISLYIYHKHEQETYDNSNINQEKDQNYAVLYFKVRTFSAIVFLVRWEIFIRLASGFRRLRI